MPYCIECGRYYDNKCICHKSIKLKKYDIFFLYLTIFLAPAIFFVYQYRKVDNFLEFVFYGNIVLSVITLLYLSFYYLFKKPYLSLFFGCHQRIDRSFAFCKKPFVLCSRCTGIFVGILLLLLVSTNFKWWFLLFGILLVLDGVLQYKTNYTSSNIKRFFTGVMFAPVVIASYSGFFYLMTKLSFFIHSVIT